MSTMLLPVRWLRAPASRSCPGSMAKAALDSEKQRLTPAQSGAAERLPRLLS